MSYAHAVMDPFNADAYGAQLPDLYPFPTSTVSLKQSTTLSSDANGNWDLSVIADPRVTLFSNYLENLAPLADSWADTTSWVALGNARMTGLLSSVDLLAYSSWRVMGLGVRIRSLLVPMTSTGTVVMATLPGPDRVMDQYSQERVAEASKPQLLKWYNLPETDGTGYYSTNLENYTTATRMDHFQFNSDGLEWSTFATSNGAYEWRDGTPMEPITLNGGLVYSKGDIPGAMVTGTGAADTNQGQANIDNTRCDGFASLHLRGLNFPGDVNVGDIEVIMHLEFIDDNTTTTGGNGKFPVVQPSALNTVAQSVAKLPLYRSLPKANNAAKGQNRLGYN